MNYNENVKILLICGGASPERDVSKHSSKAIYEALIRLGYQVRVVDPAYGVNQPPKIEQYFADEDFNSITTANYIEAFATDAFIGNDLAFIGLHGRWGEDGIVQALLEMKGIKYTGSGISACARAMDKFDTKIIFSVNGVPTPEGFLVRQENFMTDEIADRIESTFGYPAIIKPNDQGSTVGLTVCNAKKELRDAIELAYIYSSSVLIEKFIAGRELTVGVLDGEVLPVLEIRPLKGLYDYESKYTFGMTEYIVPAHLPLDISKRIQNDSEKAYKALNCKGYARLDFRLDDDGNYFCLELNTLPGMTSTSLLPKMAEAVGYSFDELIEKIVNISLE